MKLLKKRPLNLFVALIMLMLTVLSADISVDTVQAATNTKLSDTEITIGIGTYGSNLRYYHKTEDRYVISVDNPVKNAEYTYTSSNNKIVKVKASGTKAYLTGVKEGTATITCKQILDGKTTSLGKCNVIVKNASIRETNEAQRLTLGTDKLGSWVQEPICYINNRIPDAKYTYHTGSKNLTIKDTKYAETQVGDGYNGYAQTYTAKKAGTYKVTVNETYNGITRKVGTFKVVVHDLQIKENITLGLDNSISCSSILSYRKNGMNYYFKSNAKSIAYITEDNYGSQSIYGAKEGTVKFDIYEGTTKTKSKYVGSCTIKVTGDYVAFNYSDYSTYVGDQYFYLFLKTAPNAKLEDIKVIPSDKSILNVKFGDYDEYGKTWKINPLKEGKTTIVAKSGKETASCTVTVYATKKEYEDARWN